MNPRITFILLILFVALGSYIYFFELANNQSNVNETPDDFIQIYDTGYGEYDIVELEIVGAHGTTHFARTDETLTQDWEMLLPIPLSSDELDQVVVNGSVTRLGRLQASQVITHPNSLAQYGLSTPELTVTLTISNGQKIIIYMGDKTPVGEQRYLFTATDNESIYLVPDFAVDGLSRLIDNPPYIPTRLPTLTPTALP